MFLLGLPRWVHWATHGGYNFVSGPLADITLATGFLGWLYFFLRKHNCHVHRCWRLAWHPHPVHGHPVCKRHHPDHQRVHATGIRETAPSASAPPGDTSVTH